MCSGQLERECGQDKSNRLKGTLCVYVESVSESGKYKWRENVERLPWMRLAEINSVLSMNDSQ